MKRAKQLLIAALLTAVSVLGVGAIATPAQAAVTTHHMSCTHAAYSYSNFQDDGAYSRPYQLRNGSGHYQAFTVYHLDGTTWYQRGATVILAPGQIYTIVQSPTFNGWEYNGVPWTHQWQVHIGDGHRCYGYKVGSV